MHGKKIKLESKDDIVLDDSPAGATQLMGTWINLDTLMLPRADIIQKVSVLILSCIMLGKLPLATTENLAPRIFFALTLQDSIRNLS